MNPWLKIAARNLARNRRRSIFTLLAIGFGFAAVNVFAGFTEYIFIALQDGFIYSQSNGHLTIFKKNFLDDSETDPKAALLSEKDIESIKAACQQDPRILLFTPKLYISGMASNGEKSTIAIGEGVVPSDFAFITSHATGTISKAKLFTGQPLRDDVGFGVGVAAGLARKLKFDLGSDGVLMSPTVEGQMNALDIKIVQTFEAPIDALNDKLMMLPLSLARELYDTKGADRVCVLLNNTGDTDAVRDELASALAGKGTVFQIKTWYELSDIYEKTKKMFDIIFLFIFVIVMVVVVMSVINTVSMSVMERIQEIGTLRALGLKHNGILKLFALESGMLGACGCVAGVVFTLISWTIVKFAQLTWIPPILSRRVPLEVYLVPKYFVLSAVSLILLAVLCAIFPARTASRKNIVEALGHV